jgi:hypothetical protein
MKTAMADQRNAEWGGKTVSEVNILLNRINAEEKISALNTAIESV